MSISGIPSCRFSTIRYLRRKAAMPLRCSQRAAPTPSRSIVSATKAPPGATMIPVPVAFFRSGRYAVNVGVTTLKTTVPSGVFSTDLSFWVHLSEPGATPGQSLTTWAPTAPALSAIPDATQHIMRVRFTESAFIVVKQLAAILFLILPALPAATSATSLQTGILLDSINVLHQAH